MTGDIKGAQLTPRGRNGFGGDPEIHTRPCVDTRRRCHGWRATDRLVQGMPALEGTGFEPSVPLGRIGASNSAWIAFGRRLGLRIEHAISIDGWEVCDGRTSWRFFMRQIASLTVTRACWSTFGDGPGLRQQERRAAVGLGQT